MFFSRAPAVNSVRTWGIRETEMRQISFNRRRLLKGAAATGFAAANLLPSGGFAQAKTQTVNLQLGWLAGNNQIGEVAAKGMGFFEEEKLNVVIQPGGTVDRRRRDRRLRPSRDRPGLVQPVADAGGVAEDPGDVLRHRPAAASLCVFLAAQEAGAHTQGSGRQEGRHPGHCQGAAERLVEEERYRREGSGNRHYRLRDDTDPDRPDRRGQRLDHQHHDA